ncbi:MAG: glycosyltransferase family 4 protein [Paracoccus sp. (in: a-proteobacteria)]|uniref:glycosyltransferase family 4 protein n=1 Tax=Paracoccus sp. TaxID=267 RepID=UPI002E8ABE22|nr:glycosyltransferase family 4 protein [Pseudomonadota bacterium]
MTARAAFALPGDIATLTGGYIYDRRLVESLRDLGCDVEVISLPASLPTPDAADMRKALDQLAALPADVPVIIDGLAFGALETAGLHRVMAPIVAMIHHPLAQESALPADLADHLWRTERANLTLARHVMVPSPHTRDMLITRYDVPPEKITVVRPGTDRPAAPQAPVDPPLILSVGILHPRKGHDVLVEALAQLADLDWQAVIAGNPWDDRHVAALHGQVAQSGLGKRLELAGRVTPERLSQLYRQASVFALATRYEGYGIVFDEALSHGLPIVSTRTGAVVDTVPADAGLLVPVDDPEALAAALRSLLTDPQERTVRAAAAARAGAALPRWSDAGTTAMAVLDALPPAALASTP